MELPKRKQLRHADIDYSKAGAYFVTVCTKERKKILGQISIVGGDLPDAPQNTLSAYGKMAEAQIAKINDVYTDIHIGEYVIMPNHIHMIIYIYADGITKSRQHELISATMATFKRFINKQIGENIWQRSFFEHTIRGKQDYDEICKYIYENPLNWAYDKYYSEE